MIVFDHASKTYPGGAHAVQDLCMEVGEGEILVLLGTSGSGKTTTLKMVNRLIEPSSGRVLIEGSDVTEQDPIELRRRIGYAIQHIGLFPHMTVGENIAVVPNLVKWPRDRVAQRVDEMLEMVGLGPEEFRHRFPAQLSGGQQQRVGVARALAADPPVVLMDEPFGALDPITREQLQNEFIELQSRIRKTVIFVTHDVFEAVTVGDRIALMDAGQLQQVAPPAELVNTPANDFVDQFLGQHRFQLALLTRTVESVLPRLPSQNSSRESLPRQPCLRTRDSIIEALNIFKSSRKSVLPIYRGERFVGSIAREQLVGVITRTLAETEQGS